MENFKLNTIDEALEDFRNGQFVIVVDDEDRENEGDFIIAAEKITPEAVNFMLKNGRGVLCAPITLSRCKELELDPQVSANTSLLGTPFTVTIDKVDGCTTGVSTADRAATIKALADPASTPATFARPGHINPLYAQDNGVLRRAGHTEASIDLARLAGLYPAAALIEIMNEDGTMARMPQLVEIAKKNNLKIISIKDLIEYRLKKESLVEKGEEVDMPTAHGHFRLIPFRQKSNGFEHVALIKGEWNEDEPILVRVHSSCITGDIFGSQRCDCGAQLHQAMELIDKAGKGAVADVGGAALGGVQVEGALGHAHHPVLLRQLCHQLGISVSTVSGTDDNYANGFHNNTLLPQAVWYIIPPSVGFFHLFFPSLFKKSPRGAMLPGGRFHGSDVQIQQQAGVS